MHVLKSLNLCGWCYSGISLLGPKMREAKNKIALDIAILEMRRAQARKKTARLHLLKITYVSEDVKMVLYSIFDQAAQRFSGMFPLETGADTTEQN